MMDKEMTQRVHTAIRRTFEVVAGDLEECAAACGERFTLADAIEGTIDADRVAMYGGDAEAAKALYALTWEEMKAHGEAVLKEYF